MPNNERRPVSLRRFGGHSITRLAHQLDKRMTTGIRQHLVGISSPAHVRRPPRGDLGNSTRPLTNGKWTSGSTCRIPLTSEVLRRPTNSGGQVAAASWDRSEVARDPRKCGGKAVADPGLRVQEINALDGGDSTIHVDCNDLWIRRTPEPRRTSCPTVFRTFLRCHPRAAKKAYDALRPTELSCPTSARTRCVSPVRKGTDACSTCR